MHKRIAAAIAAAVATLGVAAPVSASSPDGVTTRQYLGIRVGWPRTYTQAYLGETGTRIASVPGLTRRFVSVTKTYPAANGGRVVILYVAGGRAPYPLRVAAVGYCGQTLTAPAC